MAQRGAGRSWQLWFVRVGLVVPALAMAGAPLTMGAVAKSGLKESLVELPGSWTFVLVALLPIVSIGTTLLMARFLYLIWPPARPDSASPSASLGWPMPVGWSVLLFSIAFSAWLVPDLAEGAKGTSLLASTWILAKSYHMIDPQRDRGGSVTTAIDGCHTAFHDAVDLSTAGNVQRGRGLPPSR